MEFGQSCCGCFVPYNQTSVLMIYGELYENNEIHFAAFGSNNFVTSRATIMFQLNGQKSWERLQDSPFSGASVLYCTGSFNKLSEFQVYTISKPVDNNIATLHSYNLPQNKWTKINEIDFTKIGPMEVVAGVPYTFSEYYDYSQIGFYLDTTNKWIKLNHTKPKSSQTEKLRIFTVQYLALPNRKIN